jgi:dihydroorotate dehydrogenase electron transfer subunit
VEENEQMASLRFPAPDGETARQAARAGLDLEAFAPGQFFMLWLPRLDEKPYTIDYTGGDAFSVLVQRRGPFSARLAGLRPGELVGFRGPFGRGFWDLDRFAGSSRVALIGGGCGMAVVKSLLGRLPRATVVQGARRASLVVRGEGLADQVVLTDDGSAGRRGLPDEWLREQVDADALDMVYACGPEGMLSAVVRVCRAAGVGCQVSLERYVKCGIGVCGQCECDGRRICVEGPTFSVAELEGMPSFGCARRDRAGRRVPVMPADACQAGSEVPPAQGGPGASPSP